MKYMKHGIVLFAGLMMASATAFGSFKSDVMEPWVGASKEEFFTKWGYPQSTADVVKIDDDTTVYSYRSHRGFVIKHTCIMSFTVKGDTVIAYRITGSNCLGVKRDE